MKKQLLYFAAMLTGISASAAVGDTFTAITVEGVEMTFKILNEVEKTVQVGSGSPAIDKSTEGVLTIPNNVDKDGRTYRVTGIGNDAFYTCQFLTSITIPEGVTSIGRAAFYFCTYLTSVTIPESMISIGHYAFYHCDLASITIPKNVTSIGSDSFSYCSRLESITVATGNSVYDSRDNCNAIINTKTNTLFLGCKNTIIPNGVTTIGEYNQEIKGETNVEIIPVIA